MTPSKKLEPAGSIRRYTVVTWFLTYHLGCFVGTFCKRTVENYAILCSFYTKSIYDFLYLVYLKLRIKQFARGMCTTWEVFLLLKGKILLQIQNSAELYQNKVNKRFNAIQILLFVVCNLKICTTQIDPKNLLFWELYQIGIVLSNATLVAIISQFRWNTICFECQTAFVTLLRCLYSNSISPK